VFECPTGDIKENEVMLFAYTYPFSLTDIEHSIRSVQNKFLASDYAYFNKKTLVQSVEGRPMHMITLAS
jgi:hypothetical protein